MTHPDTLQITYEDIAGAVARGWCSPDNAHKEMDSDLALAITGEVQAAIAALQPQAAAEPVAWTNASWLSNPHAGHYSAKKTDCFNVPLYTTPPATQAAALHNGHDAKHWNLLAVQRYQENCALEHLREADQEALRLAMEALQELVMRYEVLFKLYGPLAYYEGCKFESDMELGLVNAKAAIAALEGAMK
jgi:hypothetical protein